MQPDIEQLDEIQIDPTKPDRLISVGSLLDGTVCNKLVKFLRDNQDCFAWSHSNIPGIDPKVTTHQLNIDPSHKPVKQKRQKLGIERNRIVNEEVRKLIEARFIREVHYPEWIANVIIMKKKNGKWRVYIDFTDLNKTCPKDSFPLPHINRLVDATAKYELLSFMDAI